LLPVDNEDHMPPKEKSQPSESQIVLLKWWISQGASFVKKVKEEDRPDKINHLLLALQKVEVTEKEAMDIPVAKVEKADGTAIEKLNYRGVVILPVAQNSNYLKANFVTDTLINNEDLQLLLALKKQIIWLKLGFTNINDSSMTGISQLKNLTWLSLQHTNISDKGLLAIQSLQGLQYLNLVGTKVTLQGVLQLKGLKSLRSLYLYQVNINKTEWTVLQNAFPKTKIDSGGYLVPLLQTDTTIIKAKKEY
jgi:Leucine-rich repeat (LRR) protein